MFKIKNKVEEINKLASEIRYKLDSNLINEANELLEEYQKICKNQDYYLLKVDYYLLLNDIDSAIAVLNECKERFLFSIEVDNKLSKIFTEKFSYKYFARNIYKKIYLRILEYFQDQTRTKLLDGIKQNIKLLDKIFPISSILDVPKLFPAVGVINKNLILKDETGQEWLINNYRESSGIADLIAPQNLSNNLWMFWNTETIKGTSIKKEVSLNLSSKNESVCLPICTMNNNKSSVFEFNIDSKELKNEFKFIDKRFYYLRIENAENIIIKSTGDFFIGKPRIMRHNPALKKLVLYIFIDGLSAKYLQEKGTKKLMPNTYDFFKQGFVANNACASADWTLASNACIATGLSVTNHMLYHPHRNIQISKKAKLMSEYYSKKGYYSVNIENSPCLTPTYGYYKGFDRIIYKHFYGFFDAPAVIGEVLETMQAFDETNKFISISFMDVHGPSKFYFNLCEGISSQTKNNLSDIIEIEEDYRKNRDFVKSVDLSYNPSRIALYDERLKKTDTYLGIIYDYISKHFSDDEVTVALTSDHGQVFLTPDKQFYLSEYRFLVPFMIKDINAPQMVSDEIIQGIDLLPTMLKLNDISLDQIIDGTVPRSFGGNTEREFAYTETIYPSKTYTAALTTKTHIYHFETLNTVYDDGTFILDDYTAKLINRQTGTDESLLYPEKMSFFEHEVFKHVRNNIRLKV